MNVRKFLFLSALLCITFVMPQQISAVPDNVVTVGALLTFGGYSYARYKKVLKKIKKEQQKNADERNRLGRLMHPTTQQIIRKMLQSTMYAWVSILCGGAIVADQTGFFRQTRPGASGGGFSHPRDFTQNGDGINRTQSDRSQGQFNINFEDGDDLARALAASLENQVSPISVDTSRDEEIARRLAEEDQQPQRRNSTLPTPDLTNLSDEEQLARVLQQSKIEDDRRIRAEQDAEYEAALRSDQERIALEREEAHLRAEALARQAAERAEQERLAHEKAAQEAAELEARRYYAEPGIVCASVHKKSFNNDDAIFECSTCAKIVCLGCNRLHSMKVYGQKILCSDGLTPCTFVDKQVVFGARPQ